MNMSSEHNLRLGLTMASAGGAFALSAIAVRNEEQAAAPGSTGAS